LSNFYLMKADLLALALLLLLAVGASSARPAVQYLMNVAGVESFNTAQRVAPNVIPDGSVLLLSTWFGAYPCILSLPNGTAQFCNGGIPQLANLTYHREAMKRDIQSLVSENVVQFNF
jgi:hypothetical protein